MTTETDIIERLRRIATDPAARGLLDDAAVLDGFVITHDSIAEGVHFLPSDPPQSVGWKLVAVNLSDLAAKGAVPAAALLSLTISGDGEWEADFLGGLEAACESYGLPLIGGDTIALPATAPRVLGLTAIGRAGEHTPGRDGGKPGDALWLFGSVGDAAAGLALLMDDRDSTGPLVDIYRRPVPLLAAGRALAPHVHAMMDVSDGLLLDARGWPKRAAAARRSTSTRFRCPGRSQKSVETRLPRACSPRPAAMIMPCWPPCRPASMRKRFLYHPGPRCTVSGASSQASQAFGW